MKIMHRGCQKAVVPKALTWFGGGEPGMCGNSVVWEGDQGEPQACIVLQ